MLDCAAALHEQNLAEYYSETERQRGRYEERHYYLLRLQNAVMTTDQQALLDEWQYIRSIIKVVRQRTLKSETSEHTHYYISDLQVPVVDFARGIRNHWAIENRLHWVKDGFFKEDHLRVKSENAASNISQICSMVISILNRCGHGTNFKERTRYYINRLDRICTALNLKPPNQEK